ncbi:uncharacterized protein LOC143217828 [Lasioglossum baleicum]|uniref:uncharacterized protein LOC143217828 n=1 Tax=Lasioglossum baleicum TaxID=434251 RepID=UPI003FCCD8C0
MPRTLPVVQTNLNHSRRAQDLFVHGLAERQVGLAVVTEPYSVPDSSPWVGDDGGSVAIWARKGREFPPGSVVERGRGVLLYKWGRLLVAGCYISPNCDLAEFEGFLDRLKVMITSHLAGPMLVLGDFNAKSTGWGNPKTTARGEALEVWAGGMELRLVNHLHIIMEVVATQQQQADLPPHVAPTQRP